MPFTRWSSLVASLVVLAGCTSFTRQASYTPDPSAAPTPTGVQQFEVPPEGRAVIRERLFALMGGGSGITDARISNAWRTAEGMKKNPNDYAACAAATTMSSERTFVIVVSGNMSSGYVSGQAAAQRCADPTKVTNWSTFNEAMASAQ